MYGESTWRGEAGYVCKGVDTPRYRGTPEMETRLDSSRWLHPSSLVAVQGLAPRSLNGWKER